MNTLLSLFDYSGAWSEPYADAGWNVIRWDIKLNEFMEINLLDSAETVLDLFEDVDGILAAPPCTDFANSGAQYWKQKDEDGRTKQSLELVYQVMRLADLFEPTDPDYDGIFFWAMENPVGRLPKLIPGLGKPYYFNPNEFAQYTNPTLSQCKELDRIRSKGGICITQEEFDFVLQFNAYTKRTGLWGKFNQPLKKSIPAVKLASQGTFTQKFGGKSEYTKEMRSFTPEGFAKAFYEANH